MVTAVKYKKTGMDWMPEVPEHWDVKRLGGLFEERKETVSENDYIPLSVTMKGIVLQLDSAAKTMHVDNRKKVCIGDFAINSRSDRRGSGGVSTLEGSVSIVNTVLKPSAYYLPEYTHFLLTNKLFQDEYYAKGKGIVADMWSTRFSEMKTILLPVPPKDEQDEIVQYIKAQEEKINLFIQKKQRFIELLKEQKATIIKSKFTNANDNWKRRKISHSFKIIGSGTTPESGNSEYYDDGEINWVNTGDLNDGYLDSCENKITQLAFEKYTTLKIYPKGTLLIALYGATIGKVAIMNFEGCTNQACCAMFGSDTFHIEFLFHWFIANREMLIQMSYGGGQPNISQEIIRQLRILCPPVEEQKQIVLHIKTETATIDTAIAKAEREIELIREYKEAMIAEAVMGKRKL